MWMQDGVPPFMPYILQREARFTPVLTVRNKAVIVPRFHVGFPLCTRIEIYPTSLLTAWNEIYNYEIYNGST